MAEPRNARMAEAIAQNNSRDLWHELNKMKPRNKVTPPHIDGSTDNEAICDIFASKYSGLFNSVPSDNNQMRDIKTRLTYQIRNSDSAPHVTTDKVREATQRLKANKHDGDKGLVSDMIINAPDTWLSTLANMITSMLRHGYCPNILCKATITSLVKDNHADICDSSNYRGIALSSAINKIIDWIILIDHSEAFITSNLQFAFKANSSTSLCTLTLKEVASYYSDNGGNIYCAMLDASKAFDRLKYDKLFSILEKRQLNPFILRLLLHTYENQLTRTQWLTETSDYFSSSNGIRQGGVASPVLFTVYMDELLHYLESTNTGCYIGHEYFGVLCYADDVTLLAPNVTALQKMMTTCEEFGPKYDVRYNPQKTLVMQIGQTTKHYADITLNGDVIKWTDNAKHLGNVINTQNDDSNDIRCKRNDFIARSNSVLVTYQTASRQAKTKVFLSKYCCFYGSQTWKLNGRHVEELHVCWRKIVRRLLGVPRTTRTVLIPYLMNCKPFMHQLGARFLKMVKSVHKSGNRKLSWLIEMCTTSGTIKANLQYISQKWHLPLQTVKTGNCKLNFQKDTVNIQRTGAIFDFLEIRDNDELSEILNFLCTY